MQSHVVRSFGLLLLLVYLSTGPLHAIEDPVVRIEPLQPLPGQDFKIIIEGDAAGAVQLESFELLDEGFGGGLFEVTLRTICAPDCVFVPFRIEVPVEGSTTLLPGDDYGLHVLQLDSGPPESLFYARFAIGAVYYHVLRPEVVFNPAEPTDNDRLQALIPTLANYCGPYPPTFNRIERVGNVLSLFLDYSSGFGGGFSTNPSPNSSAAVLPLADKCTPPGEFLDALPVDLGALPTGSYRLDVYIRHVGPQALPVRTNRVAFTVADAPDLVALQDGRFEVTVDWRDFEGLIGVGKPVPGASNDSTLFTFFGSDNWELLVKVLDACTYNGKYWVLTAAATNVEYSITITDTQSGEVWSYDNPLGFPSPAVTDVGAFDCSP